MRLTVSGDKNGGIIHDILAIALNQLTCDEATKYDIKLATNEAINNATQYGGDRIYIDIEISKVIFIALVRDSGKGFDWARHQTMPDPEAESGRGICLMYQCMDRVEFNNCGNCVLLVKNLEEDENAR